MQTNTERTTAPIDAIDVELQRLASHNEAARAYAIASLGTRWVLHPAYRNPGHHLAGSRLSAVLAPVMAQAAAAGRI